MSPFACVGQPPVTAAALRAAAELVERSGLTGLSVTCDDDQVDVHVSRFFGDAAARAAAVAALAELMGGAALQSDDPHRPVSWLRGCGVLAGVPARVYTPLEVPTVDLSAGGHAAVAISPGGPLPHPAGRGRLPAGWRWATELDDPPLADPPLADAALAAAATPEDAAPGDGA
jgi:hypothetical protein